MRWTGLGVRKPPDAEDKGSKQCNDRRASRQWKIAGGWPAALQLLRQTDSRLGARLSLTRGATRQRRERGPGWQAIAAAIIDHHRCRSSMWRACLPWRCSPTRSAAHIDLGCSSPAVVRPLVRQSSPRQSRRKARPIAAAAAARARRAGAGMLQIGLKSCQAWHGGDDQLRCFNPAASPSTSHPFAPCNISIAKQRPFIC